MSPRVLPRRLAPMLFAAFNIAQGVAGLLSPDANTVPAYAKAKAFMPLDYWDITFLFLGILIACGPISLRATKITSYIAVFWWGFWATFIVETIPSPLVSGRAVTISVGIATLHLLLIPYRRRGGSSEP